MFNFFKKKVKVYSLEKELEKVDQQIQEAKEAGLKEREESLLNVRNNIIRLYSDYAWLDRMTKLGKVRVGIPTGSVDRDLRERYKKEQIKKIRELREAIRFIFGEHKGDMEQMVYNCCIHTKCTGGGRNQRIFGNITEEIYNELGKLIKELVEGRRLLQMGYNNIIGEPINMDVHGEESDYVILAQMFAGTEFIAVGRVIKPVLTDFDAAGNKLDKPVPFRDLVEIEVISDCWKRKHPECKNCQIAATAKSLITVSAEAVNGYLKE